MFPLQNIRKRIDGLWEQIQYTQTITIPGSGDNNEIRLEEVPDDGSINSKPVIQNYAETTNYPPGPHEFYVNYSTGYVAFNQNNAGDVVDIQYYAKGSLIDANDINYLYNRIEEIDKEYGYQQTPPSGAITGYKWYSPDDKLLYVYDSNTGKWISTSRTTFTFGKNGLAGNQYLFYFGGPIPSNKSGMRICRNACITSICAQFTDISTGTFHIRKNNQQSDVVVFDVINDYGNENSSVNVDIDKGDFLQCYFEPAGNVKDPIVQIEIAWRY